MYDFIMLITGLLTHVYASDALQATFGMVSFLCLFAILAGIDELLKAAARQSTASTLRTTFAFLRPYTMIAWCLFPLVWILAVTNAISFHTESFLYLICDCSAKVVFASFLLVTNFSHVAASLATKIFESVVDGDMDAASKSREVAFVLQVFHEIRVPLQSLLLGIDNLQFIRQPTEATAAASPQLDRSTKSVDTEETLQMMEEQGQHLSRLLDDILDLGKASSTEFRIVVEPTSTKLFLESVARIMISATRSRSIHVFLYLCPTLPNIIRIDPQRVRQCLANFLSNAIKHSRTDEFVVITACEVSIDELETRPDGVRRLMFTREQQKRLRDEHDWWARQIRPSGNRAPVWLNGQFVDGTLSTARDDDQLWRIMGTDITSGSHLVHEPLKASPSNRWIRFGVRDCGPGLSEDQLMQLFNKPFRTVESGGTDHPSTGLGLELCKRLTQHMGGIIGVRSTQGIGAEFFIDIPITKLSTEPSPLPPAASRSTPSESKQQRPAVKTLVVDDVVANVRLLAALLERNPDYPLEVSTAHNFDEALAIVTSTSFDLIFMDRHLDHKDGAQLVREILTLPSPHPPKIIGVTGGDDAPLLAAGCVAVLKKPISPRTLIKCLREILN